MTTVITRLFASEQAASAVAKKMNMRGFPRYILQVFKAADNVEAKLKEAGVAEATAGAYAQQLEGDKAVLLVSATYKPLGAVRIANEMFDEAETLDIGDYEEDTYFKAPPDKSPSILKGHPRFTTMIPEIVGRGPITAGAGMKMLKPHRTKRSAMPDGGRRMSRSFWPMPLLKTKQRKNSVISGGRHMSAMFWPMPLIKNSERRNSVIRDGDLPMSRIFGWPAISGK